jgi:hypothetical protein
MALALASQLFDFSSKLVVSKYQARVQSLPYVGDNLCVKFTTEQGPVGA